MLETLLKNMDDLCSTCFYIQPEMGSLITEVIPRRDGFYDTLNLSRNAGPTYTQFGIMRNEGCLLAVGDEAKAAYERQLSEIARENDTGTKEGFLLTRLIQSMTQIRTDVNGVSYFPVASGVLTKMMMIKNDAGKFVYFSQERSGGEYIIRLRPEQKVIPSRPPLTFVDQSVLTHELKSDDLAFAQQQFKALSNWAIGVLTPLPIGTRDKTLKNSLFN